MFKKILVPTDGSPLAGKAVEAAIGFARESGAGLVAISVAQPYPFFPLARQAASEPVSALETGTLNAAKDHVKSVKEAAQAAGVHCETVVVQSGSPYREIVDAAAAEKCDVIFMASHGHGGLSRLFVGSETQKVLVHSTLPVLVFR